MICDWLLNPLHVLRRAMPQQRGAALSAVWTRRGVLGAGCAGGIVATLPRPVVAQAAQTQTHPLTADSSRRLSSFNEAPRV